MKTQDIYARHHQSSLILLLLLLFTSCDPVFEPLKENDQYYFSINGLLDASADTQWVRVMPVRETVRFTPDPIDAVVILEHPESGETAVFQDTLMDFRGNSTAGGAPAFNYFTTMDLEPEETYRLTATGPEGKSSYAEVTLPNDFPNPEFRGNDMYLIAEQIKHLVDVSKVHYIINTVSLEIQKHVFPGLKLVQETFYGEYLVRLGLLSSSLGLDEPWERHKSELFIASGGPGWPPFSSMDDLTLQLPDEFSNVNNGVGFLAGIVSKKIPLCPGNLDYYPCLDGPEH